MTTLERATLQKAWSELTSAQAQRASSDDRIIADHIDSAERLIRGLLYERACPRCEYRGLAERCPDHPELRTVRADVVAEVDAVLGGVRRAA